VLTIWDSVYDVLGMVTCHANGWRLAHGSRVIAIRAFVIIRRQVHRLFCCWYLRSLDGSPDDIVHVAVARGCLGALLWQDKPCSPRASTAFPHIHFIVVMVTDHPRSGVVYNFGRFCLSAGMYGEVCVRIERRSRHFHLRN